MCAPCKHIFDEDVEAAFLGEDVDAALARACRRQIENLDEKVQNELIHADYWLLEQKEITREVRLTWRRKVYDALEKQAGFKFGE